MVRLLLLTLVLAAVPAACGDDASAPSCVNGLLDPGETGVDCGGACGLCPGEVCTADGVCASRVCAGGQCAVATCSDHIQNGTETGVDCGGSCPACGSAQDTYQGGATFWPDTTSS